VIIFIYMYVLFFALCLVGIRGVKSNRSEDIVRQDFHIMFPPI